MALIIDTDIGSDVDDMIAIMYALQSGIDVKLISTVHADTRKRARIAKKLTNSMGYNITVAAGERMPLQQHHLYWRLDEGDEILDGTESLSFEENGVEAIAQTVRENRKHVSIAAIGPMTNIARVIEKYPGISKDIEHIYIMGNAIIRNDEYILNYRAHNLKADPEAADIVFSAGIPTTLVTTDVCKQSSISLDEFAELGKAGGALEMLAKSALHWLTNVAKREKV